MAKTIKFIGMLDYSDRMEAVNISISNLGMAENEKRLPKSNLFTQYLNILTKKNQITASGTSQALCI